MRVIAGKYRGLSIPLPKGGTIRPTTDRAKEALFSIIIHRIPFDDLQVCDLFSGSGNIALEFASRGATNVLAVEKNRRVLTQTKQFAQSKNIKEIRFRCADAFSFLKKSTDQFDVVFADPPYHLNNIQEIPQLVKDNQLLNPNGWLIIEHEANLTFDDTNLVESRNYGQSVFSMFQFPLSLDE